jgi:branched-chain amino acid transport system ATP-binding protein
MSALIVNGLTKRFGGLTAVNNVSFAIEPGERRVLIGPNGAGKTTLFNLISGTLLPTSGSTALFGNDVTRLSPDRRAALGMARTFQINTLFPALSAFDNVVLAVQASDPARFVMHRRREAYPRLAERAERLLDAWGLGGDATIPVRDLSYGRQRQLEIVMAVACEPKLLLLDEPTSGLSPAETTMIADMIHRLPPEMAMLVIEHDMDVAFKLAHSVTVLHLGSVIAQGSPEEMRRSDQVREIYLGAAEEAK